MTDFAPELAPDLLVITPTNDPFEARIRRAFSPLFWSPKSDPLDTLPAEAAHIKYVLTDGHVGVPTALLERMPALRAVAANGVGYDAIDTEATNARAIAVSHTPDVLSTEVAASALMLYMATIRNLEAQAAQARSGQWATDGNMALSPSPVGQTVGIAGLGRIGLALAKMLETLECDVQYFGRRKQDVPYRYFDDITAMAEACDTVISVLPGGASTDGLITKSTFEALGPNGTFINIGRGSVVDEPAMITALETGVIARAGLDVFAAEPEIPAALRALPNVLLTPHIGSATKQTRAAMEQLAIDNLTSFRDGKGLLTPVPESKTTR